MAEPCELGLEMMGMMFSTETDFVLQRSMVFVALFFHETPIILRRNFMWKLSKELLRGSKLVLVRSLGLSSIK